MRVLKVRIRKELKNPNWFTWLKATFDSMPRRIADVIEAKGGHAGW
jgi:hypothetical protein